MRTNIRLIKLQLAFLLLFVSAISALAQQGSFYFSAGYNTSKYNNSTIHINQQELNNSYDLWKVKGTDRTHSPISPLLFNYRLGYYFNEWQDLGLEINFDPVRYTVAEGSTVSLFGEYNGQMNFKRNVYFSKGSGSYFYYDGLNLFLANLVKRWGVYRANTSKVSVDILGKAGIGPALPHIHSKLPVNPVDDPQLTWGGWNYGFETGVRVTLFRFGYVEVAGKYDYAMIDGLQVYNGLASQNIATFELIASLGYTFPTTRFNPLFHKSKRIVTLLPWYQHMDELNEGGPEKTAGTNPIDSAGIPEFGAIVDKNDPKFNFDSLVGQDSTKLIEAYRLDSAKAAITKKKRRRRQEIADSVAAPVPDSLKSIDSAKQAVPDSTVTPKHKKRKKKHKDEVIEAVAAPAPAQDTSKPAPPVMDADKPPTPPQPDTTKLAPGEEPKDVIPLKDGQSEYMKNGVERVDSELFKPGIQAGDKKQEE